MIELFGGEGQERWRALEGAAPKAARTRGLLVAGLRAGPWSLFILWLAWQVVAATMAADRAARDGGAVPGWPAADSSVAQAEHVLASGSEDSAEEAADLARRALFASPLAGGALRVQALAADLAGDGARAGALMRMAAALSKRDSLAQLWLFDARVREGAFREALVHADAILRVRPDLAELLLPPLAMIAADPVARPALADALAADPPWRGWFLESLAQAKAAAADPLAILTALEATASPARPAELRPYLDRLVAGGEFERAFLSWLRLLPKGDTETLPYVFNGDFERPPTNVPFDWVLSRIQGATSEITETGEAERGRALRVTFANTRVPYRNVVKLLLLPPGTYVFSGLVKAEALVNERGLTWRISCAEGDREILGESPLVSGTTAWRSFSVAFAVPAAGCRAQWLRLELAARVPIEQEVGGTLWADALGINRIDRSADETR